MERPPFRIEYFCRREGSIWRRFGGGRVFGVNYGGTPYATLQDAASAANHLIWQYHSVRVIDATGETVYQI